MALDPIPQQRRRSPLLRWHRWTGFVAALIVVVVAITGVLINHAPSLNLRQIYLDAPVVLDRYGLVPEQSPISYRVGTAWITWLDGRLFLNAVPVADLAGQGIGAVSAGEIIVATATDQIFLITDVEVLIEKLPGHILPGRIAGVGKAEDGAVVIDTDKGLFAADEHFLEWRTVDMKAVWSQPERLPAEINQNILQTFRGEGISLDRILLDIHTGRLFGAWAPYVFDVAALALLFLVVSGVVNAFQAPNRRNHGRGGGL